MRKDDTFAEKENAGIAGSCTRGDDRREDDRREDDRRGDAAGVRIER
jgi:hypothetical protein